MDSNELEQALADTGAERFLVSIVLLVDKSGSMKAFAQTVPEAVEHFVTVLRQGNAADRCRLAVVTFAERGEIAMGFTPLTADVRLANYEPEGGTRLVETVRD